MDRTIACGCCSEPVAESEAWVCVDCATYVHPKCSREDGVRTLASGHRASRCHGCESPRKQVDPVGRGRSRA